MIKKARGQKSGDTFNKYTEGKERTKQGEEEKIIDQKQKTVCIYFTQAWVRTMTHPVRTPWMWRRAPTGPSRVSGPSATPGPGTGTVQTTPTFSGAVVVK